MTARESLTRAIDAYDALEQLGEEVEDEWQYITDLAAAHRGRLEDLAEQLGDIELPGAASEAVDEAIAEIGLITDPHRAIDWLSTFPHIVGLAVGAPLWAEGAR